MRRFEGKTALVAGGGSGIGRTACEMLAHEGATIVVADINLEAAEEVAKICGNQSLAHCIDVTDEVEWSRLQARLSTAFGGIDIMVNSAGFSYLESLTDATVAHWRREIDVNLTGAFLASQAAVALMREAGRTGAIVHVSSVYGLMAVSHAAAYCAAKAGMTLLTKSIAMHCAEQKWPIRCNSVHPTFVDTPLLRIKAAMYGGGEEAMLAGMAAEVPMGRIATTRDVGEAILFLASEAAGLITGTTLAIDGGVTAGIPTPAH